MIMRQIKNSILICSLILLPFSGMAWGILGHRIVGQIADSYLTKHTKKEIFKILGNESVAMSSNWPDFIKSDTTGTWSMASKWHYVNMPGDLSKEDFISGLQKLPGENLYTQIKAMVAQIKDESLTNEKRQIALRFLIHFVGDLHQPLHTGYAIDKG